MLCWQACQYYVSSDEETDFLRGKDLGDVEAKSKPKYGSCPD